MRKVSTNPWTMEARKEKKERKMAERKAFELEQMNHAMVPEMASEAVLEKAMVNKRWSRGTQNGSLNLVRVWLWLEENQKDFSGKITLVGLKIYHRGA